MSELELQQLETLFSEFRTQLEQHPTLSIVQFAEQHPQHAQDVVALFPLMSELQGFAEQPRPLPTHLGQYTVVRVIGVGGMGVVYEVRSQSLRERLAAKVVETQHMVGKKRERFQREARLAATLHHSNIVPIYELGECEGRLFYTMRFIDGPNLAEVLHQDHTDNVDELSPDELRRLKIAQGLVGNWPLQAEICAQAASAIAHAHGQGVLHRDVKPANLLLDDTGKIWVTDFGLAKHRFDNQPITVSTRILGTPRYMAPEQIRGAAEERSDVFGLGMTLYEMAILREAGRSGRKPIWDGGLQSPRAVNPSIPRALDRIIMKAVALDPRDRHASAQQLVSALEQFSSEYKSRSFAIRSPKRRRLWALLPITVTLLGALGLILSAVSRDVPASLTTQTETTRNNAPVFGDIAFTDLRPTIQIEADDYGPWSLNVTDDENAPLMFQLGGPDHDQFVMTAPGVFSLAADQPRRAAYDLEVTVRDRCQVNYLRFEQRDTGNWALMHDRMVAGPSVVSQILKEEMTLPDALIDVATADGCTLFHIHGGGDRAIELYQTEWSGYRMSSTKQLSASCGLPASTIALGTLDGREFVAMSASDQQSTHRLHRCRLRPGGIFQMQSFDDVMALENTAGISWLDSNRMHCLQVNENGTGNLYFSFLQQGRLLQMALDDAQAQFQRPSRGHAAWIDCKEGSQSATRSFRLEHGG